MWCLWFVDMLGLNLLTSTSIKPIIPKDLIFNLFNWSSGDGKESFEDMFSAVAKSGLKQSLTHINVHNCHFKADELQAYINELGRNNVTVIDEKAYYE